MSEPPKKSPSLQPRWFIRSFWAGQRALYSVTGGRLGLRRATATRWGMMRLRTVGRRSGVERAAILGYFEDGADLVTMAMNGWAIPSPRGGSTSRPTRTPWSTSPTAPGRFESVPRAPTSGPACGRAGASTTAQTSTASPPASPARPRS